MSRLVVLHAADLHLDAPFEGVGRTPAPIAAALRDASLEAWDVLVDLALAREVAAVLLAGGLCAGLERGVRAQVRLRDGLARLSAAGIPVFIALGDDDPAGGFAAIPDWSPTVTVFPPGAPTAVPLRRDGHLLATIHGVSAAGRAQAEPGVPAFARSDAPGPHLAVLRTHIAGHGSDHGNVVIRHLWELRAAGMDYWALGSAPVTDYLATDAPWIVYPGTPQGRGLAAEQCGAKGAVLVEIEDGTVTRVDFEPVDRVRCLRVDLAGVSEPAALAPALRARAVELREQNAGRSLVLDAYVEGTPAIGRLLRQPAARAELLRTLRRAVDASSPFVWWAGVHTVPPTAGMGPELAGEDLAAEVGRRRAALAGDAGACARFLARQFQPLQELWTADVDPREASELLDEAAAVAVDALREDGG
jgi:exonuclease SbcD